MIVRTGGDVLVAEILVEGNYETPYAQVGYGLREFEIDVVSRKPGEGAKRAFDKNVLAQTFRTFDADGSGEVDADELKAAANKFGIPITDEEVDATMAELGKTRDDEINKTEFIAWFQSLAEDVRSTTPPCSVCLCEHEQASVLKLSLLLAERFGRLEDRADATLFHHHRQLHRLPIHQPRARRLLRGRGAGGRRVSGQHAQQLWLPRHAELRRAAALPRPQTRRRRRLRLLRVSLCPPRRRYWPPWQA